MSCNYAVTAYKPTAVTAVLTGNFTSKDDLNLIIIKGNNLVVHSVAPEGLKQVADVNICGRIAIARLMRPKGEERDSIVFLTARYNLAVVSFDPKSGEVVTRAHGNLKDRVGRPTAGDMLGVLDPQCSLIALHLYSGLLKVVPLKLDTEDELRAFNCRMDDLHATDMQFLWGYSRPTLAYLTQCGSRMLKTFTISLKERELVKGPWEPIDVEPQASLLQAVPLPLGGVVVVGADTISHHHQNSKVSIDPQCMQEVVVTCLSLVDNFRCLVGDSNGQLHMLFLETEENMEADTPRVAALDLDTDKRQTSSSVTSLRLELLGETSAPRCLAYLDNGVVFVGSCYGDSQLVELSTKADESGRFLRVLEEFTNLGPILDMCVVDLDKQGQDLIVSCSGYGKDGSLRVVRSGVGLNEQASIDLSLVKGIWSLHCWGGDSVLQNTLLVSFVGRSMVLSLNGEEVEEVVIESLVTSEQTFYAANVTGGNIVQVTSKEVRLMRAEDMKLLSTWVPPVEHSMTQASGNFLQLLVPLGQDIFYLEMVEDQLKLVNQAVMPYQVSCTDISPMGGEGDIRAEVCALGFWTEMSVAVVRIPTLKIMDKQLLGGNTIPRSLMLVMFDTVPYLLCGVGDGSLNYYQMELPEGKLTTCRRVVLGTRPYGMMQFKSGGNASVFVCSDHPTIIHASNNKVLFSTVNLKDVNYMCTLNSDAFKDSLVIVDQATLSLGSLDQLQMLHVQTIPLGETARRIAYQSVSGTFAVVSCRTDILKEKSTNEYVSTRESISTSLPNLTKSPPARGGPPDPPSRQLSEVEVNTVLLLDQTTFDSCIKSFTPLRSLKGLVQIRESDIKTVSATHGFQLLFSEQAVSITSCSLGGSGDVQKTYYVVGTAFVDPNEKEPSNGRVLVFEVSKDKALVLVSELMMSGVVYQVAPFNGMLVVTVNSSIHILKWQEEKSELVQVCKNTDNICALFVRTKGDFILMGDLMRSLKLLVYKSDQNRLEEVAIDVNLNPVFLSAIEMVDDETFLGADGRHIFICQKNSTATMEEELSYLQQPSRMYIGDNINVFGRGSLVMERPGSTPCHTVGKPIIYGGVHGTIGLVLQLKPEIFSMLQKVQAKMVTVIKSVGNIEYDAYRSFANDHKSLIAEGFIDGDLVEQFLELPEAQMNEICDGLKVTNAQGQENEVSAEDVEKVVEDLSRFH